MVIRILLLTSVNNLKFCLKSITAFTIICLSPLFLKAQPAEYKMSRQEYIEKYKEEAIKEMYANSIPASITLAQGILESGNGNSPLAKYANNHFGIKCHANWEGPTFIQDDDTKNECFRKYYTVYDSFKDHSEFLKTRKWYAPLFELKLTDYKGWAHGLKQAGYATNPKYAELLIALIETNKLYEYDYLKEIPSFKQQADPLPFDKPTGNIKIVEVKNNIKYIIVKPGDTPFKISTSLEMGLWQIYKYNDLDKNDELKPGDVIYLQPKRKKAQEEYHYTKKGETMHFISQMHGIKLKKLHSYNNIDWGDQPHPGDKLNLRKRKK